MVRPVSACVFTVALVTIGAAVLRLQAQTDVLSLLGRKALVVASQEAQQSTLAGKAAVGVAADAAANPPQINSALQDLIKRLPKAELHIHIEGTLEAAMMMRLAQRNNISLPYANVAEAEAARCVETSTCAFERPSISISTNYLAFVSRTEQQQSVWSQF